MRYAIDIEIGQETQSLELVGLPILPQPGETVQAIVEGERLVGIVKERHFAYEPPDVCRISLCCKRL